MSLKRCSAPIRLNSTSQSYFNSLISKGKVWFPRSAHRRQCRQPVRSLQTTSGRQEESDERPRVSLESPPEPERKPFISYPTAAIIALVSGGFLAYRLFFYSPSSGDDQPLNPKDFVKRTLTSKTPISTSSAIFNFNGGKGDANDDLWAQGAWSLEFKQPQLQIARAYTPLPPVKLLEESEGAWANRLKGFRFLIRREPKGEVSSYLHGLNEGSKLEIRGPHLELAIPSDVSDVVFLAGGTGIAPALQVAYALSRRAATSQLPSEQPVRMSILWASRTRADVGGGVYDAPSSFQGRLSAIPGQLEAIQFDKRAGDRFRLGAQLFIDEDERFIQPSDISGAMAQRPGEGKKLILVAGPDGFISHYAGPRSVVNGVPSQGPVSGVLGGLKRNGWDVWKLRND